MKPIQLAVEPEIGCNRPMPKCPSCGETHNELTVIDFWDAEVELWFTCKACDAQFYETLLGNRTYLV